MGATCKRLAEEKMTTDVMTIKEVSEYLKLNEKTAYRLASEGKIPGFKVGGSWRFRKSEIDRWIVQQEQGKQTKGGE